MKKSHKDVEFHVQRADDQGKVRIFKSFQEAAAEAVSHGLNNGLTMHIDAVVWSEAGARWLGGDDAVEAYREDPEASVFERVEVTASDVGPAH